MNLNESVQYLKGVGPEQAKKLAKLEIFKVADLINHFPYRYDDFSQITPIAKLQPATRAVVKAKLVSKKLRRMYGRRTNTLEATISDGTGTLAVVWFNQPYLDTILLVGRDYWFAGDIKFNKILQLQSPIWELSKKETVHVGRIAPVYSLTSGIYPKWLRSLIKNTLAAVPKFIDYLPTALIAQNQLLPFDKAKRWIHFPKTLEDVKIARKRLSFDELLLFELNVLSNRKALSFRKAPEIVYNDTATKQFLDKLPFNLTQSQKQAAWKIIKDLLGPHPANRLLVGDVGSGKTVVAAMVLLQAVASGKKAAVMAPTEILAQQHLKTFSQFPLYDNLKIGLLSRSNSYVTHMGEKTLLAKENLLSALASGSIDLLIGTHAVIQDSVKFSDLGIVLVDEQHRFGVQQRALLKSPAEKGLVPHFVSMTATPIPRTLALTLYGDLDVCRITEMPEGRKAIATKVIDLKHKRDTYKEITKEIKQGNQIFVICPLIDPSDKLGVASTKEVQEHLQKEVFPNYKVGLLHGQLKAAEKEKVLVEFGQNKVQVLVSTTVVEVGIDFPNATVMVIEAAERFGLAQLHQLRGRVGRSDKQSYCYLMASVKSAQTYKRLSAMEQYNDGFKLAEIDLELRGPGEIYGKLQSGYPEFKIANVFDYEILEKARNAAETILQVGLPSFPKLKAMFLEKQSKIHPE